MKQHQRLENVEQHLKSSHKIKKKEKRCTNQAEIERVYLNQVQVFFRSPFREDKQFVINYLTQLSRDRLGEIIHYKCVQKLFYDSIFNCILDMKEEEKNIHMAFEILLNIYENREQR